MASNTKTIEESLKSLSSEQLLQVADFISFLRFQMNARKVDSESLSYSYQSASSSAMSNSGALGNIQPMFE